jgi:predicted transcriptional regulator of viral defense system
MRLENLVKKFGNLPVIDMKNLLSGAEDPGSIQVQVSRWCQSGKLIKLRNNLYLLSKDFRKIEVSEFHLASLLKRPSYISMEKAFEYYGLIPEAVSVYTSITTKRPGKITTPEGVFDYRHVQNSLFWGYRSMMHQKQLAFMAYPEKALLDFFYLRGSFVDQGYLEELRLQNLEIMDWARLDDFARKFNTPGMLKVARVIRTRAHVIERHEGGI